MFAPSATHLGSGRHLLTPTCALWRAPRQLMGRSKQTPVSTFRFTSLAPLIFHFCIEEHPVQKGKQRPASGSHGEAQVQPPAASTPCSSAAAASARLFPPPKKKK